MDMAILANVAEGKLLGPGICVFIWLALVILFFIIELISMGLTSIWFAAGALAAGIAAIFNAPIWAQCLIFIVVTAVTLASTRKFAKRFLDNKLEKTNAEGMVGKTSMVIETIDNAKETGKIKIRDIEWSARALNETQEIAEGTKVVIREIRGVKCIVEPVQHDTE